MSVTKRKIIFVVPSLSGGGAEKVACLLFDSMKESEPGLDLLLVLFREDPTNPIAPNSRVVYLTLESKEGIFNTVSRFSKGIYNLYKIFRREGPCTILSFMDYSNLISIIANRLSGRKNRLVISVHTQPTAQMRTYATDIWERTLGNLIGRFYNLADGIVAVSSNISQDLSQNFGIDSRLIHIIDNPFDLEEISRLCNEHVTEEVYKEDFPIILAVGRLSKEKGFDYLLKAFSLIKGKAEASLVFIGDGKEKGHLQNLSCRLGIERYVFFGSYQKNPFKFMKQSTVFVLPSIYEGFGNVIIEAMACGVPVVATRCYDGIEKIIQHNKTGLLVNRQDEHAIAEAILTLLNDSDLRKRISDEAKKNLDRFSLERVTNQYKAVLGLLE